MVARHVKLATVVAVMLVASCGSDDDPSGAAGAADDDSATVAPTSPTSPPSDDGVGSPPQDTVEDATGAGGQSSGEQPAVVGLGDVSPECVDALITFLQAIEPSAEGIDWSGADLVDQETDMFFTAVEAASEEFSQNASVCDNVDISVIEGAEIDFLLQIAREEAPGVVPWMELLRELEASQE